MCTVLLPPGDNPIVVNKYININRKLNWLMMLVPIPVAARSKVWVCGRSPAEIVGSNPTGDMDVCLL